MQAIFKYIDGMSVLEIMTIIAGIAFLLCFFINKAHNWLELWAWKRKKGKRYFDRIY